MDVLSAYSLFRHYSGVPEGNKPTFFAQVALSLKTTDDVSTCPLKL